MDTSKYTPNFNKSSVQQIYCDKNRFEDDYSVTAVSSNFDSLADINDSILDLQLSRELLNDFFNKKLQNLKEMEAQIKTMESSDRNAVQTKKEKAINIKKQMKCDNVGDSKVIHLKNDSYIAKFKNYRQECYKSIEDQFKKLKSVDEMIDQLYENHVFSE